MHFKNGPTHVDTAHTPTSTSPSSSGTCVYSSSKDKDILEWDVESGEITRRIRGNKTGTSVLAVSTQTNMLAAARFVRA